MKNLPNIITSVRLLAALGILGLCCCNKFEPAFICLFIAAGVSDMLDGYIARRFNWCTEFGAKLDSVSDLMLYVAASIFMIIYFTAAVRANAGMISLGMSMQVAHLIFSYQKHRQFPSYHSDFARLCAYGIFFAVLDFWFCKTPNVLAFIAATWTACSLEGLAITYVLRQPASNVAGLRAALALRAKDTKVALGS